MKKVSNGKRTKRKGVKKLSIGWYISFIVIAELAAVLGVSTGLSYAITQLEPLANLPNTAWVVIIGIIIGIPISIFVNRSLLSPIRRLSVAMDLVGKGSFDIQISTKARFGDIDEIYRNFNLMTRELAANEMLKTDFVSNVSHEIKTPITAIEGYAMLLQGSDNLSEEETEYVEKILASSQRLSELVGNVLLLSKINNQAIETRNEKFSLDEQIRQSILMLEQKWSEKNIVLDVELEQIQYEGNRGLTLHVWNNLIGNAIKFTPENSTVTIRLARTDDGIVFSVDDEGDGVSEVAMCHIFDKFYQADNSHKQEGNGLGLSLVKRIIDMMDGSIEVVNLEPRGCRFRVII